MSRIAIIVPGIGYTTDRSLLYFTGKVAQSLGYTLTSIRFSGFEKGVKGDAEKMERAFTHAYDQLMEQLPEFDEKDDVLFVSKSIGTAVSLKADIEKNIRARHILFTPLVETMQLVQQLLEKQGAERRSDILAYHGLADPWATNNEYMKLMADETGIEYEVLPGANHSLETGDPVYDIGIQTTVIACCKGFLS